MNIVTVTGWGQNLDSLDKFGARLGKVSNIPYVNMKDIDEVYSHAKNAIEKCDILIGWSLGAQISCRLVEKGILKPKLLVLIAPPYQYVSGGNIKSGVHSFAFSAFKGAYSMFPSNTLRKFGAMVCQNDDHAMDIIETMDDDMSHHSGWIDWLEVLAEFSCEEMNFKNFPKTVILHGKGDEVTNFEQGKLFSEKIENSRLELIEHCGHAPHLHDPDFAEKVIREELK